jgi:hypothetical protein
LYKKLGRDNRNKDLRMEQQEFLGQYIENQLSPSLWMGANPAYRRDNTMDDTEFKSTFKGVREEEVDKVYFRKMDEVSRFAEAVCKTKILMTKK